MRTSLISPLSVEECITRFEKSKKQEEIPFSNEYHPPYGEIIGHTFTLRVNVGKYLPFMYGEFIKTREGTLITSSMTQSELLKRMIMLWTLIALPFFSFLVCFSIIDGFQSGFSTTNIVSFLVGVGLFTFYFYARKINEKQFELDNQELLDFLISTLEAKIN